MPDANEGPTALPRLGRHLVVCWDHYRQDSPSGGRRPRVPFAPSCGGAREVAFAVPLVAINGIRLMVEARGSGEPLVLVHGSWDNRRAWAFVDEQLARSFSVVSYDRRGHSDSEDGPTPGSRREDEDDLAALIETVALAPVHLVGNSFGASIALGLPLDAPSSSARYACTSRPCSRSSGRIPAPGWPARSWARC